MGQPVRVVCTEFRDSSGDIYALTNGEEIRFMFAIQNPTVVEASIYLPIAIYTVDTA